MGERGRGKLTCKSERRIVINLITEAVLNGARKKVACKVLGVCYHTVLRWEKSLVDKRTISKKNPVNKLSENEKDKIIKKSCSKRFRDMTPKAIVPILAEEGTYIASESSFYRVLRENDLLKHREEYKPRKHSKPKELKATGPNQVWSWDITYLKTTVKGLFFYLYIFMDIFSRKIVGWDIFDAESNVKAKYVMENACKNENVKENLYLHSDNGGPMKGATFIFTLQRLGVIPSYSRPRCSDDNPYSESLFKTIKYNVGYPKAFKSLEDAKEWVADFVNWYNTEHRHSGIQWVTPEQRHTGKDIKILKYRRRTYEEAKRKNPSRWIKNKIRSWKYIEYVYLNPKKEVKKIA